MDIFKLFLVFFFDLVVWGQGDTDSDEYKKFQYFGTLHTLDSLIFMSKKEEVIVNLLRTRLNHLKHQKEMIIRYKRSYDKSSREALANLLEPNLNRVQRGNVIGSSLVLSHLMTDRYANELSTMRDFLQSDSYLQNQYEINAELKTKSDEEAESETQAVQGLLMYVGAIKTVWDKFPDWQDLYMSSLAFLHIQATYGYPSNDLRIGLPIDTNYGGEFKAKHCAQLGMFALQTFFPFYSNSIEWLETGLKNLDEENDNSFPEHLMKNLLDVSIQMHNEVYFNPSRTDDAELWVSTFKRPTKPFEENRISGRDAYYDHFKNAPGNDSIDYVRYLGLCEGHNFQTDAEKSTLKCYLERKKHPYFILNPVKTEQLSHYPYVVKMYEVLGNETMNTMRTMRGFGSVSTVASSSDLAYSLSQRTSAGFLPVSYDFDLIINKKTEMLTGLIISPEDEEVQVAEYVYGRYYAEHPDGFLEDFLKTIPRETGNRLATVLYYIQDPDLGGYTPFCQAGTFSGSTAGSAIFWMNLFKNGTLRNDVIHAACPVIHGHKIIINRWIGAADNFLTVPCSLNELD